MRIKENGKRKEGKRREGEVGKFTAGVDAPGYRNYKILQHERAKMAS